MRADLPEDARGYAAADERDLADGRGFQVGWEPRDHWESRDDSHPPVDGAPGGEFRPREGRGSRRAARQQDATGQPPGYPTGQSWQEPPQAEAPPRAPEPRKARESGEGGRSRRGRGKRDEWAPLSEPRMSDSQRRVLVWTGSVTAGLATAVGLVLLANSIAGGSTVPEEPSSDPFGQARPAAYEAWSSPKQFGPIADRSADKAPLTAKEVFGTKTLSEGKIALKRVGTRLDKSCADVVWGSDLARRLAAADCQEAVRGLYTTADGTYVAQYTLFNLSDVKAADNLVDDLKGVSQNAWVRPLDPAKAGFQGYTEASGQAMGHFVGLSWIGRADGAEPGPKDDFVMLGLAVRDTEKALYRRVVAVAGVPNAPAGDDQGDDTAPQREAPPADPGSGGQPPLEQAPGGASGGGAEQAPTG
ncbi:hypothetical protein Pth03_24020 [Planotetraspora thailandica]|uniref:Uncharacterized protein n=1 Tax=Planotetraspora thailandica TaxID=487172 RepID=A0A8J3UY60_9ACTN|nr:hypothetical protein [Planotetraspora thailandica]GII54013.1 hypothetical protein Pth03_24020 [Planotetraspora thailandica]